MKINARKFLYIGSSVLLSIVLNLAINAMGLPKDTAGVYRFPVCLQLIISVAAAPLFEEWLFRKVIQGALIKRFPAAIAIVGGAALFGAWHRDWTQGVYALALGLLFGYTAFKEDWICAVYAHAACNLFTIVCNCIIFSK